MVMVPQIEAANIGMADSLVLMVMALVVFGPRRLPEIGRQLGKLMYEFRKASNDFKYQMEEELRNAEEADRRKKEEARLAALALSAPPDEPKKEPDVVPQVLDTGDNAPSYYEAAAREHTYPYEGDFPAKTDFGTEAGGTGLGNETRSGEAGGGETESGEAGGDRTAGDGPVSIQPPSTGAPVPYSPGGTASETAAAAGKEASGEVTSGEASSGEATAGGEAPVAETAAAEAKDTVTEQAAQHG